ncbi:GGDEF domain-containing protein [Psychromonas antarctica]|uniref:GGDEF domain-containing protein n=1 Tax=Psychromonas antarctica TaxID=67573 RepID=UPI001EE78EA1|nr:GGDEF domain-containing protein [Psychromonas antarctica]MCG6201430.1 GGDEF domain-containing protein [Psychromonas antarctica]
MEKFDPAKQQTRSECADLELANQDKSIVDIKEFHQNEVKISSELSAFGLVMSQMNIADSHEFDLKYAQFWEEASEDKQLLSVLICEIDFFDAYNKNYGHQAAAFMLLVIALALKNQCEKFGCFLARSKGDKFSILIKGGDLAKTRAIAEALHQSVEKSKTEHKHSSVSDIVTLSIGFSSVYPISRKDLITTADRALSLSQRSGCNQVSRHFEPQKPVLDVADNSGQQLAEKASETVNKPIQQKPLALDVADNPASQLADKVSETINKPVQQKPLALDVADNSASQRADKVSETINKPVQQKPLALDVADNLDPQRAEKVTGKIKESIKRKNQVLDSASPRTEKVTGKITESVNKIKKVLNLSANSYSQRAEKVTQKISEMVEQKKQKQESNSVIESDLQPQEKTTTEQAEYERMKSELELMKSQTAFKPRSYY